MVRTVRSAVPAHLLNWRTLIRPTYAQGLSACANLRRGSGRQRGAAVGAAQEVQSGLLHNGNISFEVARTIDELREQFDVTRLTVLIGPITSRHGVGRRPAVRRLSLLGEMVAQRFE